MNCPCALSDMVVKNKQNLIKSRQGQTVSYNLARHLHRCDKA